MVGLLSNLLVKMSHKFITCSKVSSKEQKKDSLEIKKTNFIKDLKLKIVEQKKEKKEDKLKKGKNKKYQSTMTVHFLKMLV